MDKNLKKLAEPGVRLHLVILVIFAAASLYFKLYELAAAEAGVILLLLVYGFFAKRSREKRLSACIEAITYDTENSKSSALVNFPMPIAVFRLDDSRIIWGNEMFFSMCGTPEARIDARVADLVPQFTGKWLLEGKTQSPELLTVNGKKYRLQGSIVHTGAEDAENVSMGIVYWLDVTEYDNIRIKYEETRPVAGVVVIDNLDELFKNQTDRIKNDIRDAVEDRLRQWCEEYGGILRRFDRDRYLVVFEKQDIDHMKLDKFKITEEMHQVESPNGINASVSIGFGMDGTNLGEALQFADVGIELALSRGGDQTVIKDRVSFQFFGGRGLEVEKRTKVRSRNMANTLAKLMRDSSRVLVMGHRFADLDAVGAAVGVCCIARSCGVRANVVIDSNKNAAHALIEHMRAEAEYKDCFISPQDALLRADGSFWSWWTPAAPSRSKTRSFCPYAAAWRS